MAVARDAYRASILPLALWLVLLSGVTAFGAEEANVKNLPKEAIKALYLGQQALQQKNYDEAAKVLGEYMAAATEPIPLVAYQLLGHAWYQGGDKEKARQVYEEASKAFPKSAEMLQNYTILTYEAGRYNEAAGLFEKLYRLKGSADRKLLYQAAGIYFQAENLKDAKRVLTELLTSKGEPNSKWYEDMIALCIEQSQWKEAENWARVFLARKPAQPRYWRLLAQVRLDRQEYKEAAAALEIAYRLENAKPGEWQELADLYLYLNAPLMAVRCMQAAYGKKIPAEKEAKIAGIYARTLRFDQAINYLDEAFKKSPSADLLYQKGRMLYDAMRYEEAIAVLKQCSDLDPGFGQAYILAGFAAWNIQAWAKARTAFVGASTLPKFRDQANDAISVLDDLMAQMSETTKF